MSLVDYYFDFFLKFINNLVWIILLSLMLVIDESTINLTRNDDSKMRISNKIFNECLCQNDKKKKKKTF